MMKRVLLALLVAALWVAPAHALFGRTQPLYNVEQAPIVTGSGKAPSLEEVGRTIRQAAVAREWTVHEQAPGHLVAVITPRQHMAKVDIRYTTTSYSITYNDSRELKYDGKEIHRNYNKWIKLLEQDINQAMTRH